MKFSLMLVYKDHGNTIDGNWIQDHIGVLGTAIQKAKDIKDANSNRINIAIVEEIVGTCPGLRFCTNLIKLAMI